MYSCNKISTFCAIYRPKGKLLLQQPQRNSCLGLSFAWFYPSKVSIHCTQLAATWFVARQIWTWVVKRSSRFPTRFAATSQKQVARLCCSFYRSLSVFMDCDLLLVFFFVCLYLLSFLNVTFLNTSVVLCVIYLFLYFSIFDCLFFYRLKCLLKGFRIFWIVRNWTLAMFKK